MSAEALRGTHSLERQPIELSDQLGGTQDASMGIYIRGNTQQVLSRSSSLREAEPRDQEESSSSQSTSLACAQSLSRDCST